MNSRYLSFQLQGYTKSGKTFLIDVVSKSGGYVLGTIKWWGAWKQYVFCPANEMVFNVECMNDIVRVIGMANAGMGIETLIEIANNRPNSVFNRLVK